MENSAAPQYMDYSPVGQYGDYMTRLQQQRAAQLEDHSNLLKLHYMAQQYPQHAMDLLEIYKWLQRQKMDGDLNNTMFGRSIDNRRLQNRQGPAGGDWEYNPGSIVPGAGPRM